MGAAVGALAAVSIPSLMATNPQAQGDSRSEHAFVVRQAEMADCVAIAEVYNEAIRGGRSTMDTQPFTAAYFQNRLGGMGKREALLVGQAGQDLVGWGVVKQYSDRPGYRYACEESVYLFEAHQGKGYGALLLNALLERAQELSYRHVVAKILAINEASIRFHARYGFEIVGRQRDIGDLDGERHDVVIMQRLFP